MTNWHEQHIGNLYQLCDWLVSHHCYSEAEDILQVIEKPWNLEREWGLCELYYHADSENNEDMKQRCIEAVDEYETTAEMVAAEFEVTL